MNNKPKQPGQLLDNLSRQQIMIANHYNDFAGRCKGEALHDQVLCLLQEEHTIHSELQKLLKERGLLHYDVATPEQVTAVARQYDQSQSNP